MHPFLRWWIVARVTTRATTLDTMDQLDTSRLHAMELIRAAIWDRMEPQEIFRIHALPIKHVTLLRTMDTLVTSHPLVTTLMHAKGLGRRPMARVQFLMT